eukprot:396887-Prorocentrum_minimum.AAC.2
MAVTTDGCYDIRMLRHLFCSLVVPKRRRGLRACACCLQVKEYKGKAEEEKNKAAKAVRSLQMKLTYMNRQNSQQQLTIEELQAKVKTLEKDNAKLTKQLVGIFSRWTNRIQEARVYSHDGPIVYRKR